MGADSTMNFTQAWKMRCKMGIVTKDPPRFLQFAKWVFAMCNHGITLLISSCTLAKLARFLLFY